MAMAPSESFGTNSLPRFGAMKANAGEHYRYPLTIRFIK